MSLKIDRLFQREQWFQLRAMEAPGHRTCQFMDLLRTVCFVETWPVM